MSSRERLLMGLIFLARAFLLYARRTGDVRTSGRGTTGKKEGMALICSNTVAEPVPLNKLIVPMWLRPVAACQTPVLARRMQ